MFTTSAHCVSLPFARLISHTPSYCDESLFGSRPEGASWEAPWRAKGGAAKLHTLFWTPPATPRGHSPHPRETPLRAIHPDGPSKTEPRVGEDSRKVSMDRLDSPHPLRRERSHSLTHLNGPSTGHSPTSGLHTSGPRDPRPSPSGVTFRSPLVTPRAHSVSASVLAAPPHKVGPPRNQSPLGNEFFDPFIRFAHGITARGTVSEDGTGGETTRHGEVLMAADAARVVRDALSPGGL